MIAPHLMIIGLIIGSGLAAFDPVHPGRSQAVSAALAALPLQPEFAT